MNALVAKPCRTRSPAVRIRFPLKSPASTTIMSAGAGGSVRTRYPPRAVSQIGYVTATRSTARATTKSHRKRRRTRELLVLRGRLLIEMPHRFQPLEHALHFSLVVGQQERVARSRQHLSRGSFVRRLAPKLPVRHAIDQSFTRMPAQLAQQAGGGMGIAR